VEKSPTPRVAAPNIRPFTCYEIIAMHQSEMHPVDLVAAHILSLVTVKAHPLQ